MEKRGLNEIIMTVLTLLLGIASIVLLWTFVKPFLIDNSSDVQTRSFTTSFTIPSAVLIDEGSKRVSIPIRRDPGGESVNEIKVILEDSNRNIHTFSASPIDELETKIVDVSYAGTPLKDVAKVSIASVFEDAAGVKTIAPITAQQEIVEGSSAHRFPPEVSGLLGHWDFEALTNGQISDVSGNENNGNVFGGSIVSGKIGNAMLFDGSDDYVDLGTNNVLSNNIQDFSISVWTKLNVNLGSLETNYHFFGNERYQIDGYIFRIENTANPTTAGKILLRTNKNTNAPPDGLVSTSSLVYPNDLEWHHLILVKSGTQGKIYVDRIQKSTPSNNPFNPANAAIGTAIGRAAVNAVSQSFNGVLDELRIYNRALNDQEILGLYEQGL